MGEENLKPDGKKTPVGLQPSKRNGEVVCGLGRPDRRGKWEQRGRWLLDGRDVGGKLIHKIEAQHRCAWPFSVWFCGMPIASTPRKCDSDRVWLTGNRDVRRYYVHSHSSQRSATDASMTMATGTKSLTNADSCVRSPRPLREARTWRRTARFSPLDFGLEGRRLGRPPSPCGSVITPPVGGAWARQKSFAPQAAARPMRRTSSRTLFHSFSFRAVDQGRFPQLDDRDSFMAAVGSHHRQQSSQAAHTHAPSKSAAVATAAASMGISPMAPSNEAALIDFVGAEPTPDFAAQVAEEYGRLLDLAWGRNIASGCRFGRWKATKTTRSPTSSAAHGPHGGPKARGDSNPLE